MTAALAAVIAAPATAATSGKTTLVLGGPAAKSLRAAGVQIAPARPATGGARRIVLPVQGGLAGGDTTVLAHGGGISLRRGGRAVRLSKLRLVLGKRPRLSAKLGGNSVDVFAVTAGERAVDALAGTVRLDGARLRLTHAGARAISAQLIPRGRKHLHGGSHSPRDPHLPVAAVQPGRIGALSTRASGLISGGDADDVGAEDRAKESSGCPLPSSAGPVPEDPLPVAGPPPGAAAVTGATLEWHVRESFIRYIATGEGASVSGGATADPPVLLPGASAPLSYDFHFPFAEGWHSSGADPASLADDSAAIRFGGAVRFLYSAHEIDLTTEQPEIEIAGPGSRAIFTVTDGKASAERQVLVNLDLSRAAAIEASGSTIAYRGVPAAVPAGTATSVFGGFYAPGAEFGCFDLSYSTG